MHINAWFDWNSDGDFQDTGEHVIGAQPGAFMVTQPGVYGFQLTNIPSNAPCDVHYRVRLDYGEDVGQIVNIDPTLMLERGAAQYGEVEDYVGIYDPDGGNSHPNQPRGPTGYPFPPWSPMYCHMGMTIVSFGPGAVTADGFCHPPEPWRWEPGKPVPTSFPDEGGECMDTTLSFRLDYNNDGVIDEALGLAGPVCVTRSDPYYDDQGYRVIDTEMVSLQMSGHSRVAGELKIRLDDEQRSYGQIRQSDLAIEEGVDLSIDSPAFSYFEVYFVMQTELFGDSEVVGPIEVTANLSTVPPGQPNGNLPPGQTLPDDDAAPEDEEKE
jgi:hypothetical protein